MGGTFLNKIVGLDHLADIVGWVRAEILASVSQFTDRHIILADVIEDDGLRGVEIAHPFRIKNLSHHLQKISDAAARSCR